MDLKEMGFVDVDWFYVAEIGVETWALVNMLMKLRVP
jgi:hypothetical protein